jgi:hypothetical protein
MHDQRVIGGPSFGGENFAYGVRIGGIGTEAIDGLGGKGDQLTGTQQIRRARDLSHRR